MGRCEKCGDWKFNDTKACFICRHYGAFWFLNVSLGVILYGVGVYIDVLRGISFLSLGLMMYGGFFIGYGYAKLEKW